MIFKHPIVSIEEIETIKDKKKIIFLDCTIDKVNQKINNDKIELIPNSIFFDLENKFSDKTSNLPHTLVDEVTFTKEIQNIGINVNNVVICYDRWGVYSSPRVWWMLKTMGFNQVYVLNGGIHAWKDKGFPITSTYNSNKHIGNFIASFNPNWYADKKLILSAIDNDKLQVIDARSSLRFYGKVDEPRQGIRKGHIPNSANVPFDELLDNEYLIKDSSLKEIYKDYTSKNEIIFTCGSGVTASILALGFNQINPNTPIKVYDGSWSEWGANKDLPIE